ncbi:Alpha/Beta hydrolase protein [Rhizoctonia solani]|nr:Alpha/Beta hydrolase protein [Rhizoctonia solani]
MRSFSLLGLGSYISFALAGQFPEYDGIVGGVPKGSAVKSAALVATEPDAATIPTPVAPGQLRYKENTGVCGINHPGVYQASGYADLTSRESMWFWFFEARNNPDTAPFSIWLNGGPGSSSMIGLFQEVGPCRINKDETTVSRNPYSWNEYSNMLFIDQPIGAGYSHGDMLVATSNDAAVAVWKMLQMFFADSKFSKYATRDFAIWTESYGGHYGPVFASYFLDQNAAIDAGKVNGVKINLKVLSIGNGLTDPYSQYPDYVRYAISNPYQPLANESTIRAANISLYKEGGCMDRIKACNLGVTDINPVCSDAQAYCNENVLAPFAEVYNVYDVRVKNSDPNPYPPDLHKLLTNSSFIKEIGAESNWTMTNTVVYTNFATTGDWMRNVRPALEKVINAGVRTLILSGDADYICNYMGFESMVDALQTRFASEFQQQGWSNWTVANTAAGQYKNAGTFSYLRVYQAGHEVPAYGNGKLEVGQAALVYFTQFMQGKPISSA